MAIDAFPPGTEDGIVIKAFRKTAKTIEKIYGKRSFF